jgi:predicted Fe-Mo cluster-binding NifX family protein
MRIAVPTFGSRVSPRFDCAEAVLVVSVDDGRPSVRDEFSLSGLAPHERINRLLELGVDTVVCGGIDCWSVQSLQSAGVTVYGWVAGEIDAALDALLEGNLGADLSAQGGGRWGCRWFPGEDGSANQTGGQASGGRRARGGRRCRGHGDGGSLPGRSR